MSEAVKHSNTRKLADIKRMFHFEDTESYLANSHIQKPLLSYLIFFQWLLVLLKKAQLNSRQVHDIFQEGPQTSCIHSAGRNVKL